VAEHGKIPVRGSTTPWAALCWRGIHMSLRLVPLCTAHLVLARPVDLGVTPFGRRMVAEIAEGRFDGERLAGRMVGKAAADFPLFSLDGAVAAIDARLTIETEDGAHILMRYGGRLIRSDGPQGRVAYVAPTFDTGHGRYLWLNAVQAVGKGRISADLASLDYEFSELQ
jgi:hypothetical protein